MRMTRDEARTHNARILGMIGNLDDNPRIAEVLGIACAYEVYMKVDPTTGYATGRNGFLVVLRADGPYVLYVDKWDAPTHAAAVRMACEMACRDVAEETDEKLPAPTPHPDITYAP